MQWELSHHLKHEVEADNESSELLGLWIGEAEFEGAKFWLKVLTELKNRGLKDIWQNIIPIFDYPMEIRRVIYTTNAIESLNRSLRKVIKTNAVFPDEESVFKLMYLAMSNIAKRSNRPIKDWKAALSHFAILY
jgi:transposase-like protein